MKSPIQTIVIFLLFSGQLLFGQGWETTLGGLSDDFANAVLELPDGSFAIAGANGSDGGAGLWITDSEGDLILKNDYGIIDNPQFFFDIITPNEGGFAMVGTWEEPADLGNIFFVKTDIEGNIDFSKTYGGSENDKGFSVLESGDNFYVVGQTESFGTANGLRDFFLLKTNLQGDSVWLKTYGSADDEWGMKILPADNGGFHLFGGKQEGSTISTMWVQTNADGNEVETHLFEDFYFGDAIEASEGDFVLTGHTYQNGVAGAFLSIMKVDTDGNEVWFERDNRPGDECGKAIDATSDGGYITVGFSKDSLSGNEDVYLVKANSEGEFEWIKSYGGAASDRGTDVKETADGGYIISASTESFGVVQVEGYLIKTDSEGNSFSNVISGKVFHDSDNDCEFDTDERGLERWLIKIDGEKTRYVATDFEGNFSFNADTGEYDLKLIVPNANWNACLTTFSHSFDTLYGSVNFEMPVQAAYTCPILETDISTPFIRRCFENEFTVSWCNVGTELAENASVEVELDPWLEFVSADLTETMIGPNTYSFEIGDAEIGDCGEFKIYTQHDCGTDTLVQTHCVEVNILPDSICLPPNVQWDGSSIEVEAECTGDTIEFRIQNTGDDMSDPLPFIIIEDHVLLRAGSYELKSLKDTIFKEPANGSTYRLEAEQSPFHPLNTSVSAAIEGCGTNGSGTFTIGFINQYPDSDGSPFQAMECRESIGSWDPNDKSAFPRGAFDEHCIRPNTELEYLIRFQNTGTDTAFRVVIRDTLSEFLDIENIQLGSSGHAFRFETLEENILQFTFDDIELPDSNVNEPASHGFVRFKIQQIPDNPFGTEIKNEAAIYFDFNEPVITNETFHTIRETCFLEDTVSVKDLPLNNFISSVNIFPNPVNDLLNVEVEITKTFRPKIFLYNMLGQRVKEVQFSQNVLPGKAALQVTVSDLPPGTFAMVLETEQGFVSGKFVKIE